MLGMPNGSLQPANSPYRTTAEAADMDAFTHATTLSRKAEREQFIADLQSSLASQGISGQITVRHDDGHTTITIERKELSASIWVSHARRGPVPLISWYGAERPLRYLNGAWHSVNGFHGRKATSFPGDLTGVIRCLIAGLAAAEDGSAFLPDDHD